MAPLMTALRELVALINSSTAGKTENHQVAAEGDGKAVADQGTANAVSVV